MEKKKSKKINCYPLISLLIHCNAPVQKWREQHPAHKEIPFSAKSSPIFDSVGGTRILPVAAVYSNSL